MTAKTTDTEFRRAYHNDVLLYAEDDRGFAELLEKNLRIAGFTHQVVHVTDGEQAISYLKGEGKYGDRKKYPLPVVALLDLKMPRVDGFAVLRWIREESPFPHLPTIVLTVSEELRDVNLAYKLGANSFLIKPPGPKDLRHMLHTLDQFWFKHNVSNPASGPRPTENT